MHDNFNLKKPLQRTNNNNSKQIFKLIFYKQNLGKNKYKYGKNEQHAQQNL